MILRPFHYSFNREAWLTTAVRVALQATLEISWDVTRFRCTCTLYPNHHWNHQLRKEGREGPFVKDYRSEVALIAENPKIDTIRFYKRLINTKCLFYHCRHTVLEKQIYDSHSRAPVNTSTEPCCIQWGLFVPLSVGTCCHAQSWNNCPFLNWVLHHEIPWWGTPF